MSKEMKMQYQKDRDLFELDKSGGYYCRHVAAMTSENLHSKSDIAAELGYRDMVNDHLVDEAEALREMLSSAGKELQSVIERLNQYERKDFRCDQLNPPELTDMQTASEIQELLSRGEHE